MRFFVHLAAMIAIALLIGLGLSYFALTDGRYFGAYQWGSWKARPNVGAIDPDPYSRAYIARNAQFQLSQGAGIEFVAEVDYQGEPLDLSCSYSISGATPVAAFWTLRAENSSHENIGAAGALTHIHSGKLARARDGYFDIRAGKVLAPGNWLELKGDGTFFLILTFYDASFFAGFGSSVSELPVIKQEACI